MLKKDKMACACKVDEHIRKIRQQYGPKQTVVKTSIRESIVVFFRKLLTWIVCLPFIPIIALCLAIRKLITNKPISISGFVNIIRNVRNK